MVGGVFSGASARFNGVGLIRVLAPLPRTPPARLVWFVDGWQHK